METKQNPFSVYDFLGYLLPGALFIYLVLFGCAILGISWPNYLPIPVYLIKQPDSYIPFSILAYIIGHTLSFLSSLIVERYALWNFGYPSKFLLGVRPKSYLDGIPDDSHYKPRCFIRIFLSLVAFPFSSLDIILERLIKIRELYAKQLDPQITSLINRKIWIFIGVELGIFRHIISFDKEAKGTYKTNNVDIFRAIYHYVLHNFPSHTPSLKNYVSMYGFLRTITLMFTSLFWVGVLKLVGLSIEIFCATKVQLVLVDKALFVVGFVIIAWIASYVFFMGFVKFYRRYTLEALMALGANYSGAIPDGIKDPFAKRAFYSD